MASAYGVLFTPWQVVTYSRVYFENNIWIIYPKLS